MKVKDILDLDLKVVGYKMGKENTRLEKALGALEVEIEVDGNVYIVFFSIFFFRIVSASSFLC